MTVVTDPCEIPLLAQARPMMLCINTSLPLLESVVIVLLFMLTLANAGQD